MLSFLAHIDTNAGFVSPADEEGVSEKHAPTAINSIMGFIHTQRLDRGAPPDGAEHMDGNGIGIRPRAAVKSLRRLMARSPTRS